MPYRVVELFIAERDRPEACMAVVEIRIQDDQPIEDCTSVAETALLVETEPERGNCGQLVLRQLKVLIESRLSFEKIPDSFGTILVCHFSVLLVHRTPPTRKDSPSSSRSPCLRST